VAHCGAAALDSSWDGLAMLIVVLGALYVLLEVVRSVFDGSGDLIVSAGPFPQIDGAAAFTAEGKVRAGAGDRLLADGATQFDPLGHLGVVSPELRAVSFGVSSFENRRPRLKR